MAADKLRDDPDGNSDSGADIVRALQESMSVFHATQALGDAVRTVMVPVTIDLSKWGTDQFALPKDPTANVLTNRFIKALEGAAEPDRELFGAIGTTAEYKLATLMSNEVETLLQAYREHLNRNFTQGDDPLLKRALNRVRLQNELLSSTPMADQKAACELLGKSPSNPSATMRRIEEKESLLRFTLQGRAVYPLFQFDVDARRIHPVMAKLIELKPDDYSDFQLLHWLTRPHVMFDGPPADVLDSKPDEVRRAFYLEVEPVLHG